MPRKPEPTAALKEKTSARAAKDIPVIELEGDVVQRFNEAKDQIAKAEQVIEALTPDLIERGLRAVFKHNIARSGNTDEQISSVRLRDVAEKPVKEAEKVETVLFSWTRKNKKCNSKNVETFFRELALLPTTGPKIVRSNYADWAVVSEFNTDVFLDPKTGKFSQERYDAFVKALNEVSEKLKVVNPLSTSKVMMPAADFHTRRFKDFNLETNIALTGVLPTTVQLEPERPAPEEPEEE
jgi:hypothetical protein